MLGSSHALASMIREIGNCRCFSGSLSASSSPNCNTQMPDDMVGNLHLLEPRGNPVGGAWDLFHPQEPLPTPFEAAYGDSGRSVAGSPPIAPAGSPEHARGRPMEGQASFRVPQDAVDAKPAHSGSSPERLPIRSRQRTAAWSVIGEAFKRGRGSEDGPQRQSTSAARLASLVSPCEGSRTPPTDRWISSGRTGRSKAAFSSRSSSSLFSALVRSVLMRRFFPLWWLDSGVPWPAQT